MQHATDLRVGGVFVFVVFALFVFFVALLVFMLLVLLVLLLIFLVVLKKSIHPTARMHLHTFTRSTLMDTVIHNATTTHHLAVFVFSTTGIKSPLQPRRHPRVLRGH